MDTRLLHGGPLTSFGGDLGSTGSHELYVPHLEDGGEQPEHVSDLLLAEAHHLQGLLQSQDTTSWNTTCSITESIEHNVA